MRKHKINVINVMLVKHEGPRRLHSHDADGGTLRTIYSTVFLPLHRATGLSSHLEAPRFQSQTKHISSKVMASHGKQRLVGLEAYIRLCSALVQSFFRAVSKNL